MPRAPTAETASKPGTPAPLRAPTLRRLRTLAGVAVHGVGLQLRAARHAPATLAFLLLLWGVGAVTGSLLTGPSSGLREQFGASVPALAAGRAHTLLSATLWNPNLVGYLLVTVAALTIVADIERRWGTRQVVLTGLGVQMVGVAVGLGAVKVLSLTGGTWRAELATGSAVGPSTMLLGIVMAYSARATALWRRRVRLGVLVVLATLMLYGGLLQDVLRLSTALTGLAVGALLLHRSPLHAPPRSTRHEVRTLVSVLLAATALGPVLAAFATTATGPLSVLQYIFTSPNVDPATLDLVCADPTTTEACVELQRQLRLDGVGPTVLSVLPAVLVLVLTVGLRRGRAFAWWAAVAVHGVLAVFGIVLAVAAITTPTTDAAAQALAGVRGTLGVVGPLAQPLLILGVLVATRRAFTISAPPGTYLRTAGVLGAAVAGAFAVYVLAGLGLARQFDPPVGLGQLVKDFPLRLVPAGYLGVVEPTFVPRSAAATVLFEWTGIVVWAVIITVVLPTFTSARRSDTDSAAVTARALLREHGDHSLSYLTMWSGNSYWFTPDVECYVAYRVCGSVAITTGDPVGPAHRASAAVRGFVEFCSANGWTPCLYSVTEPVAAATTAMGWQRVQVAEETVLPLGELAFTGKKFQDVRTAVNRAAKAGITAEWISYPTAPRALLDQIEAISEDWVSDKGMPEMGFTLGGLDELDDPAVRCLVAVDADRTVHGITSWLPVYRGGVAIGWTLDFMRRRDTRFKGVVEFLIGSAALDLQSEGAEFVSLSGAPLARVDPAVELSGVQRLLDVMGRTLEPVYGFRSLLAFKAKFAPRYHPLYMAYPELAALPRIGNALTRAYLPQLTLRQGVRMLSRL